MSLAKTALCFLCAVSGLNFLIQPASAESLKLSYSSISWIMSGTWVANEMRFFQKNGLDVELIYIPSSSTSVQALVGGSVDIIAPGSSGVVIAGAKGVPIVAVAASTRRAPFKLFVQPEITNPQQLKGKVLGVTRFNSTTHMMAVLMLRKLGLEQAVSIRQLGDVPAVHSAFEQKLITAMTTSLAPRTKNRVLTDSVELDVPYAGSMLTVTRSYLREHRGKVESALRAYIEGIAVMLKQRDTALRILEKYMRRGEPAFLAESYDDARRFLERIPKVDPEIVPPILEFGGLRGLNPEEVAEKVIDNSLVEKLEREKFIENLFKK